MDATEQRAGFRLPWSDRREPPEAGATEMPPEADADQVPPEAEAQATEGPHGAEPPGPAEAADANDAARPPARRPSRFLAELTRAMHAAAEEGRTATLDQVRADGKSAVEGIQVRSADDAATIRRHADEDVAGIREWSKAEIARVREETEQRVVARKSALDRELDGHAAIVEAEIENVQAQVSAFEGEMDAFFERLIAEEDPGRFAALAASLPEPPPFTALTEERRAEILARTAAVPTDEEVAASEAAEVGEPGSGEMPAEAGAESSDGVTATAEQASSEAEVATGELETAAADLAGAEAGPEVAVEAAPEATGDAEVATGEPEASVADLAGAERDALTDVSPDEEETPGSVAASISARLAGLAGAAPQQAAAAPAADGPAETSQVIVTGLTSVSSIAAFKRQVGRLQGVRSVAVSSGPSGEFVFAVTHAPGVALADGVATLGGFAPQVTRAEPGVVEVAARDPEA